MPSKKGARSKKATSVNYDQIFDLNRLSLMFVFFMIAHSVVVFLGSVIFPSQLVLGTHLISPLLGLVQSMLVFTLLAVVATPVIEVLSAWTKVKLSDFHWIAGYFVINFFGLWGVARFAEILGMGVASWVVVVVLAVVFDLVQGIVVKVINS